MTRAFQPFAGPNATQNLAVTGTSQTMTFSTGFTDVDTVRIVVDGAEDVFIEFYDSAASTTTSMMMLANTAEVFSVRKGTLSIKFIAATTGSTVRVTVGTGV